MLSFSIPLTLVFLVPCALAQNDCYYAAGQRAGSAIIPCGSSDVISACCQIGDLCLSDSACWDPTYNVTYLYGCSDPNYADSSCPWKCGSDFNSAPYVGLVYCYNTTQNEWACTHPPSNDDSIQPNPPQQCYDDSIVAFAGPSSLQPILSLPTNVGGSTEYFSQVNPTSYSLDPNYTPTTTVSFTASVPHSVQIVSSISPSATSTTVTESPQSSNTDTATTSPSSTTDTASSSSPTLAGQSTSSFSSPTPSAKSSGLSTGAKAGIGVGVGVGALAAVALVGVFFFFRRRRYHEPVSQMEENSDQAVYEGNENHRRPFSELEGSRPRVFGYDQSGHGDSNTMSTWDKSAPTYMTKDPGLSPLVGRDELHELG